MSKDLNFILDVLTYFGEENDHHSEIWWRVYDDGVHFLVYCNDVFGWACADCEDITPENFPILKQAVTDCCEALKKSDNPKIAGEVYASVYGFHHGLMLFCSRVRGERPQGAAYPEEMEVRPLFDACGPERPKSIGNPYSSPEEYRKAFPKSTSPE